MYTNTSNAYAIYQENNISTASSPKLLLMLYDGAIKFCRFAEIAIEEKNIEKRNHYLMRAQDIIRELTVTLNHDAGDISKQLEALYDFMNNELILANIHNERSKVEGVKNILEELRNTWAIIIN